MFLEVSQKKIAINLLIDTTLVKVQTELNLRQYKILMDLIKLVNKRKKMKVLTLSIKLI